MTTCIECRRRPAVGIGLLCKTCQYIQSNTLDVEQFISRVSSNGQLPLLKATHLNVIKLLRAGWRIRKTNRLRDINQPKMYWVKGDQLAPIKQDHRVIQLMMRNSGVIQITDLYEKPVSN